MRIAIRADENQKKEILQKGFGSDIYIEWINANENMHDADADAFFDLLFDDNVVSNNRFINDKMVFVHGVNCTCNEINKSNYIRLNAWRGFINRPLTELAASNEQSKKNVKQIFDALGWRYVFVADDYGLIAARIIAMIVNEAYYAVEENVSSKEQIDIAMKLGTNYPYGPFEWSERIGLMNILNLLQKLSEQNKRYSISDLLVQESQQI